MTANTALKPTPNLPIEAVLVASFDELPTPVIDMISLNENSFIYHEKTLSCPLDSTKFTFVALASSAFCSNS